MQDFGRTLDAAVVERGLRELNTDLHFDLGAKINQWHPSIEVRQGVYYRGKHICSMDRGQMPEYKVWTVVECDVPCSFGEADNEGVVIRYKTVPPNAPGYADLYEDARLRRLEEYAIDAAGRLLKLTPVKIAKVRGRCVSVGWRHTFERLIHAKIPGVTREAIAAKFGVNMLKFPVGRPEEMVDVLMQE